MPSKIAKIAAPGPRSRQGRDDVNGPEQRKLRNRMSQRAFRARQAMRIQELEERLEQTTAPNAAYVTQLQDQNALLKEKLLSVHKKAIGMQISLKALADAAAQALGIDQPCLPSALGEDDHRSSTSASENAATPPSDSTIELERPSWQANPENENATPDLDLISCLPAADLIPTAVPTESLTTPQTLQDGVDCAWSAADFDRLGEFGHAMRNVAGPSDFTGQILELDGMSDADFAQQALQRTSLCHFSSHSLGPSHYKDLFDRARPYCTELQSLRRTNSSFSDHIDAFEACLADDCATDSQMAVASKQLLGAIEFMITAFVNISWTRMASWETYTRTLTAVKDLTAWRIDRSPANLLKIVPQYRPTRLQISVAHPSVIDWIPWPSLRDKLIVHHSANPKLDQVISDVGKAYVVQADLSTLVRCPQPVVGYVSVWTLVQAVAAGEAKDSSTNEGNRTSHSSCGVITNDDIGTSTQSSKHYKLPASSVNELFESPTLARAAHQKLGLSNAAASNYRLDPSFFELYPELYDSEANIMAQGVRLRPSNHLADEPYPVPDEIDAAALSQYREFSKIALAYVAA